MLIQKGSTIFMDEISSRIASKHIGKVQNLRVVARNINIEINALIDCLKKEDCLRNPAAQYLDYIEVKQKAIVKKFGDECNRLKGNEGSRVTDEAPARQPEIINIGQFKPLEEQA